MTVEHIKTIVLSSLIAISLLLTVAIWNYQPNLDELGDENIIDAATKINGQQKTMKEIVEPKQLMFHENNRTFSLTSRTASLDLFDEMRTWPMTDFETLSSNQVERESKVEVIFPTAVPLNLLGNTLSINEEEKLPEYNVDRMFVEISNNQSSTSVYFVTDGEDQVVRAVIRNFDVYKSLDQYLVNSYDQVDYLTIDEKRDNPIYIPEGEVTLPVYTYTTTPISVTPLINVLFNDPNMVRPNSSTFGQSYYTDSTRQLRINQDQKYMRFVNPSISNVGTLPRQEVLKQSLDFVNDHNGWTDNYKLFRINDSGSTIDYRIFKKGYPVFDDNNLSLIQQTWAEQELYAYDRAMVQFATLIESESQQVTLASGQDVLDYLNKSMKQFPLLIEDIAIGYKMEETNKVSLVLTLKPVWYIKTVGGDWKPLSEEGFNGQGGVQ
ncbi:YycH family regulatory protein [Pontibacillus yanchengensis]|uniref:Regulatory protein YycH domain-containing protein n=1 Tax=Pontibacillus yanchengensis Y32 TaxID=1385514 RepID=A0A0A2TCH3_9BACI|nr:two-component system activity regulator YycH [Pontibacillus yanchengensis]KGP73239.1 hypothetical protein N782_06785 [Pontibacillus yanchengensis Y32]